MFLTLSPSMTLLPVEGSSVYLFFQDNLLLLNEHVCSMNQEA
jgi:hypothetical protein